MYKSSKKQSILKNFKIFGFSTGRKKSSLAQVIIFPGQNLFYINLKHFKTYFQNNNKQIFQLLFLLKFLKLHTQFNIFVYVKGGGIQSQVEAIILSIARILVKIFPSIKSILKYFKFLKYDSRIVERKKYGLKKARKASQYSKR